VIEGSTGAPVRLNRSSAVADSGRERTVGSHLGIFAKPLPGFINDIVVAPDDTSAQISWVTLQPASAEVQYGLSTNFGSSSGVQTALGTNHQIQLIGLTPATGYYFRIGASNSAQQVFSPPFYFTTTNYVTTNGVFEITNSWVYTAMNLDGVDWTSRTYDDSAWSGPGPGLFWIDTRTAGPNEAVQPKNTELLSDPANDGFPYVTYYFRTRFALPNFVAGSSLAFSAYIDDGAIFYLNGTEIYRLRMPASASNNTLATAYPCEGDATCLDEFTIPYESLKTLAGSDNLLAVEVHNYNLRSGDVTFGMDLKQIEPLPREATLSFQYSGGALTLSWTAAGFVLQSADSISGQWMNAESGSQSPVTIQPAAGSRFFRLSR